MMVKADGAGDQGAICAKFVTGFNEGESHDFVFIFFYIFFLFFLFEVITHSNKCDNDHNNTIKGWH